MRPRHSDTLLSAGLMAEELQDTPEPANDDDTHNLTIRNRVLTVGGSLLAGRVVALAVLAVK